MNAEGASAREMNVFQRVIGIFTSPKETFESIDQRPTWFIPLLIFSIVVIASQFLLMDISIDYRMEVMETQEMSQEQLDMARQQSSGPLRFIGLPFVPVGLLIVYLIQAALYLFVGNVIMGGDAKFKKYFSLAAWIGLIGILATILQTYLVMSKGSPHGVTTSLAVLLPTPAIGASKSALYLLLTQFEIFAIWQLVLWTIGLSVVCRFTVNKAATMVISLFAIWCILAVVLGNSLGKFMGM